MPLLRRCSGCSLFVFESTPEAVSNFDLGGISMSAVKVSSLFGVSKEFLSGRLLGMIVWFGTLRTVAQLTFVLFRRVMLLKVVCLKAGFCPHS